MDYAWMDHRFLQKDTGVKIVFKPQFLNQKTDRPFYATAGSAGVDVKADIAEDVLLGPSERKLINTGIYMDLGSANLECQVRSRSGLALKKGLIVANSPGTIDSDYRGECGVILLNTSNEIVKISPGERIAQFVFTPVNKAKLFFFEDLSELTETARASGGFGSTGV